MSYHKDILIQIQEGSEEDRDGAALEYLAMQQEADAIDRAGEQHRHAELAEGIILDSIAKLDAALTDAHITFRRRLPDVA